MSNEKRDEFFSWRSRLDQPDALPEQGLDDRNLTWDRLSQRLHQKPRRRMGYWIAAACLLLALLPATRLLHHHRPGQPAPPTAVIPQPTLEIEEPILKSRPIRLKPHKSPPAIAITPPPQTVDSPVTASPILIAQQPETPPDTPHKQIIAKQLRVVHINDLDATGRPEPSMTSVRDRDPQIKVLVLLKNH